MPVKPLWLFLSLLPVFAQASDDDSNNNEALDLSLLEFLGSFEEKDNVWLDAMIDETQTAQVDIKQKVNDHE